MKLVSIFTSWKHIHLCLTTIYHKVLFSQLLQINLWSTECFWKKILTYINNIYICIYIFAFSIISQHCDGEVNEWVINSLSRTVDSLVHVTHMSCVIITYTMESLSPPTYITHNLQVTIDLRIKWIQRNTKYWGHPLSWLVIGDGNFTSLSQPSLGDFIFSVRFRHRVRHRQNFCLSRQNRLR